MLIKITPLHSQQTKKPKSISEKQADSSINTKYKKLTTNVKFFCKIEIKLKKCKVYKQPVE